VLLVQSAFVRVNGLPVGFIVQPVVAALFGFVTWPILEATRLPSYGKFTQDTLGMSVKFALQMGFVGVFVAFGAAMPLFAWLRERGPITSTMTLVSGALLGNLPIAFVLLLVALRALLLVFLPALVGPPEPHPTSHDPFGLIRVTVFGTAAGVTCAAVFWRIVGPHLQAR
jgi:hypothetical protein